VGCAKAEVHVRARPQHGACYTAAVTTSKEQTKTREGRVMQHGVAIKVDYWAAGNPNLTLYDLEGMEFRVVGGWLKTNDQRR
jgi:hypothetical protein